MNTRMIINTAVAITLVTLFASCSPSTSNDSAQNFQAGEISSNIVGGVNSSADFQKANGIVGVVMVFNTPTGGQMMATCTGSLIADSVVLTAAHCLVAPNGVQLVAALVVFDKDINKVLDEVSNNDLTNVRVIDGIKRHELYGRGKGTNNDIGLIHFQGVQPADFKIATRGNAQTARTLRAGTAVTLSGFGDTEYKLDPTTGKPVGSGSGLLRQVDGIKVLSLTATGEEITLDQSHGRGACHGDSGGPAFIVDQGKNILIGVTSRSTGSMGLCDSNVIYTGVIGYTKWISDNLQKLGTQQAK